jgi:hypothetical protein
MEPAGLGRPYIHRTSTHLVYDVRFRAVRGALALWKRLAFAVTGRDSGRNLVNFGCLDSGPGCDFEAKVPGTNQPSVLETEAISYGRGNSGRLL